MTATDLASDHDPAATDSSRWQRVLVRCGLVYLFSRVCVMAGAGVVASELIADSNTQKSLAPKAKWADPNYIGRAMPRSAVRLIMHTLSSWDGNWYLEIVRHGYPTSVRPNVTYNVTDARAAFFPLYPMLVRGIHAITPGGEVLTAIALNVVLGAAAVWLVGLIARHLYGVEVAERAMILMAVFPGAFVLSFAYTEALLICLAAACMLFLLRRQWLLAGLAAALATAARPNGIAVVAACAVASYLAIRERREWRSMVAPLLSPLGVIAFQLYVGVRAHERGVWFRVQHEAWREGTSYGMTAIRRTYEAFIHPLSSPTNLVTAASVITLIAMVWCWSRFRLPAILTSYSAIVIILMLLPETVTARPRFLYTAFPLLIPAAEWFGRHKKELWPYTVAACAAGLVTLTALYGVFGAIP
jgi:hypothetical protein